MRVQDTPRKASSRSLHPSGCKIHALVKNQGLPKYALYHHRLNFRIGAADKAEDLTRDDLQQLLALMGLRGRGVGRFLERELLPMLVDLDTVAAALPGQGLKILDDLIGREIDRLAEILDMIVPILERDYFQAGGGGWGAGS